MQSNGSQINEKQIQKSSRTIEGLVIQWFCFLLSVLMKLLNVTGTQQFRKV